MDNSWWEISIAVMAVAFVAIRRFDMPISIREYTTAARYYTAQAGYVSASLLLFFSFYFLCVYYRLPSDTLLSLLLTLASACLLHISKYDGIFRRQFHSAAAAPFVARRLADTFVASRFHPSEKLMREVKSVLILRGFDLGDDWFPAAEAVRKLWFHSAMCFYLVRNWDKEKGYRNFVARNQQDFDLLRQRFDQLSCHVVRVLIMIERLASLWSENEKFETGQSSNENGSRAAKQRAIVSDLIADLREDVSFFHESLSVFIARGILTEAMTKRERQRRLMQLGFDGEPEEHSRAVLLGTIFAFYVAVFFFLPLITLIAGEPVTLRNFDEYFELYMVDRLPRIMVIAASHTIGIALVILPKTVFGFANDGLYGRTPWGFIFGAGILAAMIFLLLRGLLAYSLESKGIDSGRFRSTLLWCLSPFTTTALCAYLVQDSRWLHVQSTAQRKLLDVGVVTIGMVGVVEIVRLLQHLIFDQPLWPLYQVAADLSLSITIGTFVGYFVPSAFRRRVPTIDKKLFKERFNRNSNQVASTSSDVPKFAK